MGFWSELFGIKVRRLNVPCRTLGELYEMMRGIRFDAGYPSLERTMIGVPLITFPEIDRNNQVQIMGRGGKFWVFRTTEPLGRHFENRFINALTLGISALSALFGANKRLCFELVDDTADRINAVAESINAEAARAAEAERPAPPEIKIIS